ncbi:MAG: hypothetical protein R3277_12000 [Brumimicrobium sp.]|nr:hypothetical protein [Brumimicrobium sp.]
MKNNLEKTLKEQLENFEVPYDENAWVSLEKQLDARSSAGGNSSALKWIAASIIVAGVAVGSYILLSNPHSQPANRTLAESVEIEKNENQLPKVVSEDEQNKNVDPVIKETPSDVNQINSLTENKTSERESLTEKKESVGKQTKEDQHVYPGTPAVHKNEEPASVGVQESKLPKVHFIAGNVSKNVVCAGEAIQITNNGSKSDIVRFSVNGEIIELKKAHSYKFVPTSETDVRFMDDKNNVIEMVTLRVNDLPQPDFTVEANIYENGLPVTNCQTYGDYEVLTWRFNNSSVQEGKSVTHHFFDKGDQLVQLTVKDFNGCENTVSKQVRIENQYNLMAVEAFKPNGTDPRNKSFMPFSLTQRDVKFTMTIIDPRTNEVIYTSQDAGNAWTGIDQRTGKMTPSETVYIWKVQIHNPLPNERPVYAGTVVHN